ncbi:MAG: hypothetical protein QME79_12315 [Bacillota bacterium]|nr:hypothetical protein [Bacillota bacterium]
MAVTAEQYKAGVRMVWEEPVPSGVGTFLLKKPTVEDLAPLANHIPVTFDPEAAAGLVVQKALAGEENGVKELLEFSKTLLLACVLGPKLADKPIDQCAKDEVPLTLLDPADRNHIVAALLSSVNYGGTPAQKSFRKKPKAAARARRDGEAVQGSAEPTLAPAD